MSDPYADLGNADADVQAAIADAMAARSVEPAQMAIRRAYLQAITLPEGAFAVEMGSGTGHTTRDLIEIAGADAALGIEPAQVMVDRARAAHADLGNLRFEVGDAKATGLADACADMVLMHTLLCHVPGPEEVVHEAFRILKPGGVLAFCDGDYDLTSVATGDKDPLDPVVRYMIDANVHDRWVPRRIVPMLAGAGFAVDAPRAHGYLAEGAATYFMTVVERGLAKMLAGGLISDAGADGLRAEAQTRIAEGRFYGFMSYLSVIARKPEP